nr:MAG TPA: hypothetical protein [Caudoviricetes sp.]
MQSTSVVPLSVLLRMYDVYIIIVGMSLGRTTWRCQQ